MKENTNKNYHKPIFEFIEFNYEDVISASSCTDCIGDVVCPSNIGCLEDES